MAKIIATTEPTKFVFFCPACREGHYFDTRIWTFNGDMDKPTVRASILTHINDSQKRCHSFITDGKIEFQGDCAHSLKGQTVDLPDFDALGGKPVDPEVFPPDTAAGEKAFWDRVKGSQSNT